MVTVGPTWYKPERPTDPDPQSRVHHRGVSRFPSAEQYDPCPCRASRYSKSSGERSHPQATWEVIKVVPFPLCFIPFLVYTSGRNGAETRSLTWTPSTVGIN